MLVCFCVREVPTTTSSDDAAVQTGSYIWAIAQAHWVSNISIAAQWRFHSSIAGIIHYDMFKFMVSLSKEEILSLRKLNKDIQVELSKLTTRLLKMEQKR